MKVRSVTDVITNSSNETFICRSRPDPIYEYSYTEELTWEAIKSGHHYIFHRDLLVMLLDIEEISLKDNPWPVTYWMNHPWTQAEYGQWSPEELDELWEDFVEANKSAFESLIGYSYVAGRDDNEYEDYDQWKEDNDDLGKIAVLRAGRDCDFIF